MSTTSGGPNIVTNGLVLHLDAANTKSFRGEPTTNLVQPWSTGSNIPTGYNYGAYEYNATVVDSPVLGTEISNQKWIKFTKNSGTNGRSGFLTLTGLNTGSTYMWSAYVYTNDSRVSSLLMQTDNVLVSSTLTASAYNASLSGSIQRISCSLKSNTGNILHGIRGGATDPTGSFWFISGMQLEENKTIATPVVFGTRGTTVATGGGWADRTSNAYHGELVNGPTYNAANGGSIVFDGVDDYVPLSNTITLGNTFTILSWIKLSTLSGGDYIVYGTDANGADNWFGVNGNSVNLFFTQTSDVNNTVISGGSITSTNIWYHIGCTINGNVGKVYLNGVEQNSTTVGFTIGSWNTSLNSIGRRGSIAQRYFPGNISMVQAYNRVLSASEILQNYNSQKSRFGLP